MNRKRKECESMDPMKKQLQLTKIQSKWDKNHIKEMQLTNSIRFVCTWVEVPHTTHLFKDKLIHSNQTMSDIGWYSPFSFSVASWINQQKNYTKNRNVKDFYLKLRIFRKHTTCK